MNERVQSRAGHLPLKLESTSLNHSDHPRSEEATAIAGRRMTGAEKIAGRRVS